MAIFILLQEAMPITEMFDLTLEAINIEAFEYVAIESNQHNVTESQVLIVESNQENEGLVGPSGKQLKMVEGTLRGVQIQHNLRVPQQATEISQ